jgi:hypothetical protein
LDVTSGGEFWMVAVGPARWAILTLGLDDTRVPFLLTKDGATASASGRRPLPRFGVIPPPGA